MTKEEEKKLWAEYKRTGNPKARDTLIRQYIPLCRHIAGKVRTHLDYEDTLSLSYIGLMDAVEKFQPSKGILFKTYAYLRIRGEIYDGIRKSYRRRITGYREYEKLESELGREPTVKEIEQYTGLTARKAQTLLKKVRAEKPIQYDDTDFRDKYELFKYHPEAEYDKEELKKLLRAELNILPEREKKIIILYYYEELNLKEIGFVLDVTESRISQILKSGVERLRANLKLRQDLKVYIGE